IGSIAGLIYAGARLVFAPSVRWNIPWTLRQAVPKPRSASASHKRLRQWRATWLHLAAVVVSLLLRYALGNSLGIKVPYVQFYPAIIFAAWYGRLAPGILATTVSALSAMYFSMRSMTSTSSDTCRSRPMRNPL